MLRKFRASEFRLYSCYETRSLSGRFKTEIFRLILQHYQGFVAARSKGLFKWKEGAPANRATRLEGLTHSPPLHATHLTGTVCECLDYLLSGR